MSTFVRQFHLRPSLLALAVLAAFGPVRAEDSVAEASVGIGVAHVTGESRDRSLFGLYNGLRDQDNYGLIDFDYRRRNPDAGTATELRGSNLGLDTRELIFWWKKQGDWKVSADYGELVRREPYSINTGLVGAGSATPQVLYLDGGPGSGSTLDLKTKRKAFGVGFAKWLGPSLEFQANVRSENKEGARLYGIGMNCPSVTAPTCGPTTAVNAGYAVLLLPEPIDSNHTQVEARLNFAGDRLGLSGGYYGSLYNNSNGSLRPLIPDSLNGPLFNRLPLSIGLQGILSNPVALPPDNQAHHFDLAGNYAFTPTTRGNFKVAYSRATQDQDFVGAGLTGAPAGVSNLGGKVDTTLAQVGLSARPIPRLSLIAEARYEDRDDNTPIALYNVEGAATYTNRNYSQRRSRGKLEASYQITSGYRGTVGVDYEKIERQDFTPTSAVAGISALRYDTEETSYRAELRRRMTENFSGAISYIYSDRNGSNWLRPNSGLGVTEVTDPATGFTSTAIFSPTLADRRRDKIRVSATWQASEALSLQFLADNGKDKFSAPTSYAVRRTDMEFYSADFNLVVSDAWNINGYASRGKQSLDQARPAGYVLAYDSTSDAFGLGFTGKGGEKIDFGGTVSYLSDRAVYAQTLDVNAGPASAALLAATGGLPDVVYRRTEFRMFGRYALSKASSVRLDAIHQRAKYSDWAYGDDGVPFVFSDNTTLSLQQVQNVTFVGVTYVYAWP